MRRWGLLLAGAAALGGCRSDGGIDRQDAAPGLRFAASRVALRTEEDADATVRTLGAIPAALARDVTTSLDDLAATWSLYLDGHAPR